MKILGVEANNRRRTFEIRTRRGDFTFPYASLEPRPERGDRVAEVFVDPELGREAFTYVLASGAEGSVHVDNVFAYNDDPTALADLLLHRLTVEAVRRLDAAGLSRRELARRLGTSLPQLYRLLDPTNTRKSLRQLLALLHVLGCRVEVEVNDRESA